MEENKRKARKPDTKLRKIKKGIFLDPQTGNYRYRFEHNGKDYEKVIGPQRLAAEAALAEAKQEIRISQLSDQGWEVMEKLRRAKRKRTFGDAARDYMESRGDPKPSTLAQYSSILRRYLLPAFGSLKLSEIDDIVIGKFQTDLAATKVAGGKRKISARRTNTVMQLLRTILSQEFKAGRIVRDPSLAVRRVDEDKAVIDPLSRAELERCLQSIDEHYRPLFTVLAFTGARPNELLALRWTDVYLDQEFIRITKGRVRGKEGDPKTKSAKRDIPITSRVKQILQQLVKAPVVSSLGYVFTKPNGQPIDKHLDRIWARALRKAEIKHRPSYQLRHTFATQCIIERLPLPYIAKILGHSTIDTLIRHYAGWIDSATQENNDKLKAAFQGAIGSTTESKAGIISGSAS